MKVIETSTNDFKSFNNQDEFKVKLSNDIISFVQPIFTKEYSKKINEIKNLKLSIEDKKEKIKKDRISLESSLNEFKKKDKESQLLGKLTKLLQTGLIQDNMKNEMKSLLDSFNDLPEEKITNYLNETIRILSRKFAKS